ncbi:hypothetical protein DB88DRAFT_477744 [Papiliotrema laurentii]|uniref:Uncharacterized protein n=1 Tax=Papiliotrema laurentii TaxID=5418 RepID=A0AAD9FW45_PAPLA|nr:hypothetical protein DB88DRAFT_477744 [Papiliotrema laurentii]
MAQDPQAGPSRVSSTRKPKSPHPDRPPSKRKKYAPALPLPVPSSHPATAPSGHLPSLPNKTLQGQGTRRTEISKPGYGRDVVFVTRKVSLGALMGRCRSLLVDEGYTRITLFAITAAIPHALLLLHALIDLLPYPKGPKGMWYEIHTGTTECVDEVDPSGSPGEEEKDEFAGIGAIEAAEPERKSRLNSTMRIDLHITPRPARTEKPSRAGGKKKANRPSKQKRMALLRARQADKPAGQTTQGKVIRAAEIDEEEMMNQQSWGMEVDEEEEAVEEVERGSG